MAEGSFRMESESYNAEDMDEGSDEVGEEEMVEGNDYEEFGAFGGYGTLTSFDIRLLRAFGSLGPGLRILTVRPPSWPPAGPAKWWWGWGGWWLQRGVDEGEGSWDGLPRLPKPNLLSPAERKGVGEALRDSGGWLAAWKRLDSTWNRDASVQSCLPYLYPSLRPCRMSPGNWKTLCWPGL